MKDDEINILLRIKKAYSGLTGVKKKLADYILQNPQRVIHMPMDELASNAGVSQGSIVNFAKQMGVSGFTKLKIGIAQYPPPIRHWISDDLIPDNLAECDSPKGIMQQMIRSAKASFDATSELLTDQELERAASILSAARRIDIYGAGASAMVAADAYYRLMRIGLPAFHVTDNMLGALSASLLDEHCAAFGISHRGKTPETLRAMKIAKGRGAKTLYLGSVSHSPLADLCDVSLIVPSQEAEANREAVFARLTQQLVIDSLCAYINSKRPKRDAAALQQSIELYEQDTK